MVITFDEKELEESMDSRTVESVLGLLARWALRRARRRVEGVGKSTDKGVIVDFSRDYTSRNEQN